MGSSAYKGIIRGRKVSRITFFAIVHEKTFAIQAISYIKIPSWDKKYKKTFVNASRFAKFVNFFFRGQLPLYGNYQEVVIIQWYCSYHSVLSFDVWLHWNRNTYIHTHTRIHTYIHICMHGYRHIRTYLNMQGGFVIWVCLVESSFQEKLHLILCQYSFTSTMMTQLYILHT